MFDNLISAGDLAGLLGDSDLLIVDCRFDLADVDKGLRLYRESHIPGAFYAHLDHQLSSPITPQSGRHPLPDATAFCDWLNRCGFDGSQQVVAYDDSGCAMASRLWWLLRCMGHERVACLDGGWKAWLARNGTVTQDMPQAISSGDFKAGLNPDWLVTTGAVLANIEDQAFVLVDVRAAERFRGEMEPIDPVAGHVPGAENLPLTENLAGDGRYKSGTELAELYAPLLERRPLAEQVYMCGSGVTACHSLLALASAGFDIPRVYAGSWSEWIRNPDHPVAVGAE